ncbi:hypothetical protein AVEN_195186-1 [Araneus ventricosus]|uniref:Uncharacterized protein n=1 Tax=Araneus ventricosus TaxID=182803 RepID=A0A4Y2JER3_ARAVE|nr:hypothetical protein AVEN_195186-1 [Araneus ventricosus]
MSHYCRFRWVSIRSIREKHQDIERPRRGKGHTAQDVVSSELMTVTMPQKKFLCNNFNKGMLIALLSVKLESEGFLVKQATEDAAHLIVTIAIVAAEEHKCAVLLEEDIDLLIVLTGHQKSPPANISFLKPGKGTHRTTSSLLVVLNIPQCMKNALIFLRTFSGCDTTSSFYRQGKKKFILRNEGLLQIIQVYMRKQAQLNSIIDAEQRLLVALYGGIIDDSLDGLRFQLFTK